MQTFEKRTVIPRGSGNLQKCNLRERASACVIAVMLSFAKVSLMGEESKVKVTYRMTLGSEGESYRHAPWIPASAGNDGAGRGE